MTAILCKASLEAEISNDNYCAATKHVSACGRPVSTGAWGENGGCVFKVGDEMYFVPTQEIAGEDMLYITCDAQKIEGPLDGWRSKLALGAIAGCDIEDAILDHLHAKPRGQKPGESFVVTRDGRTFKL